MSKKSLVRWIVLPVTMVAVGGLIGNCAIAADPIGVAAHMDTFTSPDGVSSFALSMKPTRAGASRRSARHRRVVQHVGQSNGRVSRQGDRRAEGLLGPAWRPATAFAWWPSI